MVRDLSQISISGLISENRLSNNQWLTSSKKLSDRNLRQIPQNYICLPCPHATTPAAMCPDASGFAFILFTPEATLFNDDEKQIITHFFSPNPDENGTIRVTWQHSRDTSTVWAMAIASSSDPTFVAPGAIPWLLLEVVGAVSHRSRGHLYRDVRVRSGGVSGIHPGFALNPSEATDVQFGRAPAVEQALLFSAASEANRWISAREETRWRIYTALERKQDIPMGVAGCHSSPVAERRSLWQSRFLSYWKPLY